MLYKSKLLKMRKVQWQSFALPQLALAVAFAASRWMAA